MWRLYVVGVSALLCVAAASAINNEQLYERFILDGHEDDYLLLEQEPGGGVDEDQETEGVEELTRPVLMGRDDQYDEDNDGEDFDHAQEADIVLHSSWAPKYDAAVENVYKARCPPPPTTGSDCGAPSCTSDRDCQGNGVEKLCCHNGCVRTCKEPAPPPIEIDWVDRHSSIYDTENRDSLLRLKTAPQHAAIAPQMVTMAGGCVLTLKQFKELAGFSKNDNINRCFCDQGGVFCEVAHNVPAKE